MFKGSRFYIEDKIKECATVQLMEIPKKKKKDFAYSLQKWTDAGTNV